MPTAHIIGDTDDGDVARLIAELERDGITVQPLPVLSQLPVVPVLYCITPGAPTPQAFFVYFGTSVRILPALFRGAAPPALLAGTRAADFRDWSSAYDALLRAIRHYAQRAETSR